MSQFLVAVLCDSFDLVREELEEAEALEHMPDGHRYLNTQWSVLYHPEMILNQFRWFHSTMGFRTTMLCEALEFFSEREDDDDCLNMEDMGNTLAELSGRNELNEHEQVNLRQLFWNFGAIAHTAELGKPGAVNSDKLDASEDQAAAKLRRQAGRQVQEDTAGSGDQAAQMLTLVRDLTKQVDSLSARMNQNPSRFHDHRLSEPDRLLPVGGLGPGGQHSVNELREIEIDL